jgi:hypothetical protein
MFAHKRQLGASVAATAMAASMLLSGASAASAAPSYRLELVSLECLDTETTWGPDHAYLRVNGETVWARHMNENHTERFTTDTHRNFDAWASIQLWDDDSPDADDLLGTVTATPADAGKGERTGYFREDGADYKLIYRVVGN